MQEHNTVTVVISGADKDIKNFLEKFKDVADLCGIIMKVSDEEQEEKEDES